MNTKHNCLFLVCLLLFCVGLTSGCQKASRLEGLVPAAGVVFYEGNPVPEASVIFSPTASGGNLRSASTTTDSQGHFSMKILDPGDGVFPGEYAVSITKIDLMGEPKKETRPDGTVVERGRTDQRIRELLPVKYREAKTSGLIVTIPEKGDKNIEFRLEGKVDDTPKLPPGPGRRR